MTISPSESAVPRSCLYCGEPLLDDPKGRRRTYCGPSHRSAAYQARKRKEARAAKTTQIRKELEQTATYLGDKALKLTSALDAALKNVPTEPHSTVIPTGWEKKVNELAVGTEAIAHRIAELAKQHRRLAAAPRRPPTETG